LFRAARGGVLHPDSVRISLFKLVIELLATRFPNEKDEIGLNHGRLHSFRHFLCSDCANQGVHALLLMRRLGHRSSDMVQRYFRLHDQESQRQTKSLKFGGRDAT
jgi:integrase